MFCTSELCKNLSIIVAIFFALYLIVTNSSSNAKELFTEQDASTSNSSPIEKVIKDVWKSVYNNDISDKTLKAYVDDKSFVDRFKSDEFKNNLVLERIYSLQKVVEDVFLQVLKRQPTPEEKKMYVEALYSNKIKDQSELERIVSNSPENATTSDATRSEKAQRTMRKEDYALYKKIIDEYKDALDRLPSTAELNFYFDKMKNDSTFDLAKLNKALTSSREHLMLEMNQRNVVNGELEGNVTERQLELVIKGVYEEIYGYEPDEVTYKFMRTKFIDMHLNEEAFLNFVKQLKRLEDSNNSSISNNIVEMKKPGSVYVPAPEVKSNISVLDKVLKTSPDISNHSFDKPELSDTYKDTYDSQPEVKINTTNIISDIKDAFDSKERSAFTVYKKNDDFITDHDILESVRESDKVMFPIQNRKNETKLANEYDNRNDDVMKFRESQSRYVNADKDMVLNPEFKWSVPQARPPVCYGRDDRYSPQMTQSALIGTLLDDAKDTQVGSIMPKFKFTV